MSVEGIGTFWAQEIAQEKLAILTKVLNYTKSSCVVLYAKMSQYFHYTYCLQEE